MSVVNSNRRIAKNTFFLYIRMILVLLVSLYTTKVVFNALGIIDYGIYNVVAGFVSMFAFLNTSMANAIQRYYNYVIGKNNDHSLNDVYITALQIQAILALIIFISLELLGTWYMYNEMSIPNDRFEVALIIFHLSVISMVFVILQIPYSSAIMAFEHMDFYAYVALFDVFAKLIVAYILSNVDGNRLYVYGILQLLVTIIVFLLYYSYSKYNIKGLNWIFKFKKKLFGDMISFSGWNTFGSFAYMLKGQGVNMVLNSFFGPVVNAARGISYTIMGGIQGFQGNIITAFRPQLVQSYAAKDYDRVQYLFYASSKISFLMLSIISIPIMFEINYILHLWLGSEIPDYTASFTILILINQIVSSLNTPLSQIVHATGKMCNYQITTSAIICMIVPVSWIFLKLGFNPNSVYVVSLVIVVLNQIICCVIVNKLFCYGIVKYIKEVILPCLYFSVLAPLVPAFIVIYANSSFNRFVSVIVLGAIWSCLVAYYAILNQKEQQFVYKIFQKYVRKGR